MKPREIGKSYDAIAERWDGPEFKRSNGIEQHERAMAFVQEKARALDVGCGCSGRLTDLMIAHGFEVESLDISAEMLRRAKLRHPDLVFHHQDICTWVPPHTYDFITAWDSIWHVPLAEHEAVLKKLFESLAPGGVCIFSAGGLDAAEEMINQDMGPDVYYSCLGIPRTLALIDEMACVCRHLEYDQYPELHVYYVVQKSL